MVFCQSNKKRHDITNEEKRHFELLLKIESLLKEKQQIREEEHRAFNEITDQHNYTKPCPQGLSQLVCAFVCNHKNPKTHQ